MLLAGEASTGVDISIGGVFFSSAGAIDLVSRSCGERLWYNPHAASDYRGLNSFSLEKQSREHERGRVE